MDSDTALVIIDMQMEMQHRIEAGRPHVHPDAPATIATLADAFRRNPRPVIHIRHAATDPASPFHPDAPGYPPMACAVERPEEAVFVKRSSSVFATTELEVHLRERGDHPYPCRGSRGGILRQFDGARGGGSGVWRNGGTRRGGRVRPALCRVGSGGDLRRHHGLAGGGFRRGGRE